MGKDTKIEWATSTWNPFIGCSKVSPACDNCYAERWAKRCGRDFSKVVRASSPNFNAPKTWKEPERIFVCSLSDFFHQDILRADRHAAIKVMRDAPHHTYILLTKRPENIKPMLAGTAWGDRLPDNVWVGVTAENQKQADRRIPLLLRVPAKVRFVSCEPLLGPVELSSIQVEPNYFWNALDKVEAADGAAEGDCDGFINWVICGGESGGQARPMHPAWARSLRDQCAASGVPFMFKQWGEFSPYYLAVDVGKRKTVVKEFETGVSRVGKHLAGRLLDGVEHNGVPA